ncbi:ABC transporter permease [Mongoliimonas terrestris]|uniref:ABC transporter permease n=1 Tax=Mongoliimonas terrestris TaxID=1709001 RepID=UPI00094951DA|nr:ABC transporter permease [Mongoliimonas terrestris]
MTASHAPSPAYRGRRAMPGPGPGAPTVVPRRLTAAQRAVARRVAYVMASFALAFVGWYLISHYVAGPFLIPPPLAVLKAFGPMSESGQLYSDIGMSLSRVAVGYTAGVSVGLLVGLLMGRIKSLHDLLDPMVQITRFLSPTAMIPIVVIWFGIGETAKYALVFWGTVSLVLINTIAGVLRTPQIRQNAALCLGASEAQIFRLIVLPSAVPFIVIGMRLALASAFVSIIPAELLAADSGLGYLLQQSSLLLQTDRIFVALVTICLVGFLTDQVFHWTTTILLRRYLAVPS